MDIKTLARNARNAKLKIAEVTAELEVYKDELKEYFDANNITTISIDSDTKHSYNVKIGVQERLTINYTAEALKAKLNPDIFSEIIDKEYHVDNIEYLVKLMKEHGVPAAEFRKCISSTTTINKEKVKQLHAIGDITSADLKGCYTATVIKAISIE